MLFGGRIVGGVAWRDSVERVVLVDAIEGCEQADWYEAPPGLD